MKAILQKPYKGKQTIHWFAVNFAGRGRVMPVIADLPTAEAYVQCKIPPANGAN